MLVVRVSYSARTKIFYPKSARDCRRIHDCSLLDKFETDGKVLDKTIGSLTSVLDEHVPSKRKLLLEDTWSESKKIQYVLHTLIEKEKGGMISWILEVRFYTVSQTIAISCVCMGRYLYK